jgi:hypothetical protein
MFIVCDVLCMSLFQVAAGDTAMNLARGQPNVEAVLNTQPDTAQQELRKPTIGGRKPQAKRSGVWRLCTANVTTISHCFFFSVQLIV